MLVKVHRKLCCVNVESGEWWVEMSILWSCGSRQPHWWLVATTGTGWWLSPSCTPNLVKDKIQWKCEGGNNSHFTKLSNNRINKNDVFMDCWLLIFFVVSQNKIFFNVKFIFKNIIHILWVCLLSSLAIIPLLIDQIRIWQKEKFCSAS